MADDEPKLPEPIQVEAQWVDIDQVPLLAANQMLAQVNLGEVFLTFGQIAPPPFLGTPEQQKEQAQTFAEQGAILPIRPVARVFMTAERLREMVEVLNDTLARHELQQRAEAAAATEDDQ